MRMEISEVIGFLMRERVAISAAKIVVTNSNHPKADLKLMDLDLKHAEATRHINNLERIADCVIPQEVEYVGGE